mmetsp:Transcript_15264/g.49351  ORF Transcript_15264/g.49351 Transcript_15264/m.49351 type:complete len:315 (-) Transcript_15264:644-1588(-)
MLLPRVCSPNVPTAFTLRRYLRSASTLILTREESLRSTSTPTLTPMPANSTGRQIGGMQIGQNSCAGSVTQGSTLTGRKLWSTFPLARAVRSTFASSVESAHDHDSANGLYWSTRINTWTSALPVMLQSLHVRLAPEYWLPKLTTDGDGRTVTGPGPISSDQSEMKRKMPHFPPWHFDCVWIRKMNSGKPPNQPSSAQPCSRRSGSVNVNLFGDEAMGPVYFWLGIQAVGERSAQCVLPHPPSDSCTKISTRSFVLLFHRRVYSFPALRAILSSVFQKHVRSSMPGPGRSPSLQGSPYRVMEKSSSPPKRHEVW